MAKRSLEKAAQGALSFGAYGAQQGNRLRKMYGPKATGVGAAVGSIVGGVTGYLSGSPDPNMGQGIMDQAAAKIRANTMLNANQAANAVSQHVAQDFARRGLNQSALAAGVSAANQGRIYNQANQALIPLEAQMEMQSAQDRLNAQRAGEYEKRQGWQDTALALGSVAQSFIDDRMAQEQAAPVDQSIGIPEGFGTWTPQEQSGWLTQQGFVTPQGWDQMSASDRMNYITRAFGLKMPLGPYGPVPDPRIAEGAQNLQEYINKNRGYPGIQGKKYDPLPKPVEESPEQQAGRPPDMPPAPGVDMDTYFRNRKPGDAEWQRRKDAAEMQPDPRPAITPPPAGGGAYSPLMMTPPAGGPYSPLMITPPAGGGPYSPLTPEQLATFKEQPSKSPSPVEKSNPPVSTIPTTLHDALPQETKDEIAETAKTPATSEELSAFRQELPQSYQSITHPSNPFAGFVTQPYTFQMLQQAAAALGDDQFAEIMAGINQLFEGGNDGDSNS